ncbi:Uncharacterized protein Rs2_47503 [Raphanus sativus]|nr:Uncharacterized protein Rs2_47503 [Raphanus sativus]
MVIRSYGARNLVFLRRYSGSCRAILTKPKEMVNGMVLVKINSDDRSEARVKKSRYLWRICLRKPGFLISAAEQIFNAGGKKTRALVNYFPSRYNPVRHAEKYPTPPAVCYGKRERFIIEKENNFKEPRDIYCSFTPERQECFIGRWIDALSDPPPITHKIRSICISYWSQADKSLGQKLASRLNVRPSI